jgi:hypothetical protein
MKIQNIFVFYFLLNIVKLLEYKKNAHIKMRPKGESRLISLEKAIKPDSIVLFYSELCVQWYRIFK